MPVRKVCQTSGELLSICQIGPWHFPSEAPVSVKWGGAEPGKEDMQIRGEGFGAAGRNTGTQYLLSTNLRVDAPGRKEGQGEVESNQVSPARGTGAASCGEGSRRQDRYGRGRVRSSCLPRAGLTGNRVLGSFLKQAVVLGHMVPRSEAGTWRQLSSFISSGALASPL